MNYGDDEIDLKKRPTDQGFYLLTYLRDSQSRHQYLLPPSAPSWRNFAASMVVAARERWQDERVFGANREPTHVPLRAYEDVAAAHAAQVLNGDAPPASRWVKPLTPSAWAFNLARTPASAPSTQLDLGFDTSDWGVIDVPLSLEAAGYGQAQYTNVG